MSDWEEELEELGDESGPEMLPDDGEDAYSDPLSASAHLRALIEVHKWPQRLKWNAKLALALGLLPFEGPLGRVDGWLKERKREKFRKRIQEKEAKAEFIKDVNEASASWDYREKEPDEQEELFKEWQRAREEGLECDIGQLMAEDDGQEPDEERTSE